MNPALPALGAVVIAACLAGLHSRLRGYDEPGFQWLKWWAPKQHRTTARVVTATHAAVGVIASAVAMSFGWYPLGMSLWWLNALFYALVGEAVFRSDWAPAHCTTCSAAAT